MNIVHFEGTGVFAGADRTITENLAGGFNRINFHPNNSHDVSPIIINAERHAEIQSSFMLFFSGFSRYATEIAEKQIANFDKKKQQLRGLGAICDEAMEILQTSTNPVQQLGELLHEGWMLKRELADGVATPEIDEMYNAGIEAGAIGGKLLGAGGGGFMLMVCKSPDHARRLKTELDSEPTNDRARFFDYSVNPRGLTVTVC